LYGYQKESTNGDLTLAFLAATQEAKKKRKKKRGEGKKARHVYCTTSTTPTGP
jgi:hypothetical protein